MTQPLFEAIDTFDIKEVEALLCSGVDPKEADVTYDEMIRRLKGHGF